MQKISTWPQIFVIFKKNHSVHNLVTFSNLTFVFIRRLVLCMISTNFDPILQKYFTKNISFFLSSLSACRTSGASKNRGWTNDKWGPLTFVTPVLVKFLGCFCMFLFLSVSYSKYTYFLGFFDEFLMNFTNFFTIFFDEFDEFFFDEVF